MKLTGFMWALAMLGARARAQAADESAASDSDVIDLTGENFADTVASSPLLLAEFFAPWCGHCKALAPEYEAAATELKDKDIKLGKVDCTQEMELCQKHGITGFPTLRVFRADDSEPVPYTGGRKREDIVGFMTKQSMPAVSHVTAENLTAFSESDRIVFVSFLPEGSADAFADVAKELRSTFLFGAVAPQDSKARADAGVGSEAAVVAFKAFDDGKEVYTGPMNADEIKAFVQQANVPFVDELSPKNFLTYVESGRPLAYLFYESDADKESFLPLLQRLGRELKGKVNFVTLDAKLYGGHAANINLAQRWPAFGIQDLENNSKYAHPQNDDVFPTLVSLEEMVKSFVAGELSPTVKSQPVPDEPTDNGVTVLVGLNYNRIVLDDSKDVLVEFYAPWCGHCKKLAPAYGELASLYASDPELAERVVVAKVDATENDTPEKVEGFPTIKLFAAGRKDDPITYEGDRSIDSFIAFIKQHGTHQVAPTKKEAKEEPEAVVPPPVASSEPAQAAVTSASVSPVDELLQKAHLYAAKGREAGEKLMKDVRSVVEDLYSRYTQATKRDEL